MDKSSLANFSPDRSLPQPSLGYVFALNPKAFNQSVRAGTAPEATSNRSSAHAGISITIAKTTVGHHLFKLQVPERLGRHYEQRLNRDLGNTTTIAKVKMKEEYEHEDDAQLAAMGHRPELKRNFSTL